MTNAELAVQLALILLQKANEYAVLVQKARAENRDVTDAELDALAKADDQARAILEAAIAKAP